jgi:hypothetical protein
MKLFRRAKRELTQDELCKRGQHMWRPWFRWSWMLWASRYCENCGHKEWGLNCDYSAEYLNRVRPPHPKFWVALSQEASE